MDIEDVKDQLREFNYYKQLILHGETNNRNVIVERKDGTCAIAHHVVRNDRPVPGLGAITVDQIERITVFVGGQEYEFVACQ